MQSTAAQPKKRMSMAKESPFMVLIRVILILAFDAGALWFGYNAYDRGFFQLVAIVGVITVMCNLIFLLPQAYPFRWMAIGLSFLILFTIYPIISTVYVAFTNYGDGHLLSKEQVIPLIQKTLYLPPAGKAYSWTAYKSAEGKYAVWLVDADGQAYLGKEGEAIRPAQPGDRGIGAADGQGIPKEIEGYQRINVLMAAADPNLPNIKFGLESEKTVQIRTPKEAAELVPLYAYDAAADTFTDQSNGDVYAAVDGTYSTKDGKELKPGFRAEIGFQNFVNFVNSPALSGPLTQIVIWNFIFPTISVLSTFALGLAIAVLYNDKDFPLKKVIRTLLLIPYTIPGLITILIWKGMLNPEFGVVNRALNAWFGWAPPWTTEPIWAQAAVLLVNLWLGYPYFMLVTSGALQSISADLYEAATVDGANPWQKFTSITLPLLLVAVGPLLIASYVYNFNNFNLIYLFIGGGPPIVGATTQAGHTDILISYVYNLAFASGGRGVQYGLASAISIVVFIIVGAITLFQYRFTNMWEEASTNV